jgi:hypothetical protein
MKSKRFICLATTDEDKYVGVIAEIALTRDRPFVSFIFVYPTALNFTVNG